MALATRRNDLADDFHGTAAQRELETAGNFCSVTFLEAAIDGSLMTRKALCEDHLRISEGELSKLLASGRFRLDLIDKLPPAIRAEWRRLMDAADATGAEREAVVMAKAAHALIDALTVLKNRRRMAKAGI
jgi:hypothetical protein